jgi:hypothetical protein
MERLVADITQARDEMDYNLRALQVRLRQEANPRAQARKHPWIAVGVLAGLTAGVVLTGLLVYRAFRS